MADQKCTGWRDRRKKSFHRESLTLQDQVRVKKERVVLAGWRKEGVKRVEAYEEMRRLHWIEGMSVRAIARRAKFHRKTVKKILMLRTPTGYRRVKQMHGGPKLGPMFPIIELILQQAGS